jgi:outer membrane receptor protein involved in Fe transport
MSAFPRFSAPLVVRLAGLATSLALTAPWMVIAQSAANPGNPPVVSASDQGVVTLSPFDVTADESGYRATNSVVATGFNRDVEHTPLTINVLTEDFIRDAGLGSYAEISQFMPNTYVVPDPTGLGSTGNARGQATSYYSQDGVRYYTEPIVRTGARVEVIKGPATLFFGRAQPGGIFNFGTRPPSAIRQQTLTVTVGSYGKKSVDLGSQGKLDGKGRFTYRLDGSYQDNGSFIDEGYDKLKFVRGAFGYKLSDTLRLNAKVRVLQPGANRQLDRPQRHRPAVLPRLRQPPPGAGELGQGVLQSGRPVQRRRRRSAARAVEGEPEQLDHHDPAILPE